jgi:hypothetical protein
VSIDFLPLLSILRGMSVYLSLSTAQATAQAEGQQAKEQQATAGNSNRQQARQLTSTFSRLSLDGFPSQSYYLPPQCLLLNTPRFNLLLDIREYDTESGIIRSGRPVKTEGEECYSTSIAGLPVTAVTRLCITWQNSGTRRTAKTSDHVGRSSTTLIAGEVIMPRSLRSYESPWYISVLLFP